MNPQFVSEALEGRILLSVTFTVSNLNDSGAGSLREAISDADVDFGEQNIVSFASGLSGTINLASALPVITNNLAINGPGAGVLTVNGHGHGSVFTVARVQTSINNLTITGGNSTFGGAIFSRGRLNIANSVITGNSASGDGSGGGVFSNFYLGVANSTISGNAAYYGGGGIYNESGVVVLTDSTIGGNSAQLGGGIFNHIGSMTVTASTISGNSAVNGGGVYNADATLTISSSNIISNSAGHTNISSGGGILNEGSTLTLMTSTVSGNSAADSGGGIDGISDIVRNIPGAITVSDSTLTANSANYGAGILNAKSSLTVANSTITGNNAGPGSFSFGGGVECGYHSTNTIVDSTISGNSASRGGGIVFDYATTGILDGAIVAANSGGDYLSENSPSIGGSNDLIGDGSDGGALAGSLRGTAGKPLNPLLSALGSFGGPTQTLELTPGSPAIGAGANFTVLDSNDNDITATDQRGIPRPSSSGFDIGAFQSGSLVVNTLSDPAAQTAGILSLREAITLANTIGGGQEITFASGLAGTISLASQLPTIGNSVTIDGPGANVITVNGGGHGSVVTVAGFNVLIENLTISGGNSGLGGGIFNSGGLSVANCVISGNSANAGGGGIYSEGFVGGLDGLMITDSTISGNSTSGMGGGIDNNSGKVTVVNSTLSGNTAQNGGAVYGLGSLIFTDSTISANSGLGSGALVVGGSNPFEPSGCTLDGTIVAGNTGTDLDLGFAAGIGGSNDLIGNGNDGGLLTSTLRGVNPMLSPLGNFGGLTPTMAPLAGSPALGTGANFNSLATDQRGFSRPTTSGIDIGADQGALFAGDTNFDGIVNLTDLLTLLNNYGQTGRSWTQGDFNFDGTVNLTDLLALLNDYGASAKDNSIVSPAAAVVSYKAASSPFASVPLVMKSSTTDVDGEILQVDAGVL
jgi:hypothetical protein